MIRSVFVSSAIVVFGVASVGLEKVKLEFKHVEERVSTVQAVTKTHQILTLAGMDIETSSTSVATVKSTTGKRGPDGRLPIQQKIEAITVQMSFPGGIEVSFDSANPNAATSDNPMLQAILDSLRARVGSAFTIVLGKDNKVLAIEGIQQVLDKASPAAVEILKAEFNPEHLKSATEQSYAILPDSPIGEGDTWNRTNVSGIGGGQTMTFDTKYEYLGTVEKDGQKLDKIGVTALTVTYALDPNVPTPVKVTQSNLKIESSKGTLLFDRVKGQAVESTGVTRITGDMTLSINGMDLPSKLDLTFDSSSIVQK
jgi:hypothetical protein